MTDAPERIWVNRLTGRVMPQGQNAFADGVEYIRADTAPLAVMAMREAAIAAIPTGWTGKPHVSNMDYGPNVATKAISAIRALSTPTPEALLAAAMRLPEVAGMVTTHAAIRAAITEHHLAYDRREHGGVADSRLVNAVQQIMDMPWHQGAALAQVKGEGHE